MEFLVQDFEIQLCLEYLGLRPMSRGDRKNWATSGGQNSIYFISINFSNFVPQFCSQFPIGHTLSKLADGSMLPALGHTTPTLLPASPQ